MGFTLLGSVRLVFVSALVALIIVLASAFSPAVAGSLSMCTLIACTPLYFFVSTAAADADQRLELLCAQNERLRRQLDVVQAKLDDVSSLEQNTAEWARRLQRQVDELTVATGTPYAV